jgi:hypothetical protein
MGDGLFRQQGVTVAFHHSHAYQSGSDRAPLAPCPTVDVGAKFAEIFFSGGEHGGPRQAAQGLIRAAASEPMAGQLFCFHYGEFFIPIFRSLGVDHPEFRAVTVSSLFAGFTFTSRVVDLESLGGSDRASKIAMLATLVQTALTVEVTTPVVASAAGSAMPPTIAAHRR